MVTTVSKAKELKPPQLDAAIDRVTQVVHLAPTLEGQTRRLELLLEMAYAHPQGYALMLKALNDLGKQAILATHSLPPALSDAEIARSLMWNTGMWQGNLATVLSLETSNLETELDKLRFQGPKI